MQSSDVYDINKIRSKLFRVKFTNEQDYLEDNLEQDDEANEGEENWITARINKLKMIIGLIDKHEEEIVPKTTIDHENINKLIYKKAWLRLPLYHKTIKLEEYLNNKLGDELSKKSIKKLVNECIELINSKKIISKHIKYNSNKGEIDDIPCLVKDEDTESYSFELKKNNK